MGSGEIFESSCSFLSGFPFPIVANAFEMSIVAVGVCLFCRIILFGSSDSVVRSVTERRVLIVEIFVSADDLSDISNYLVRSRSRY